MRRIAWLGAGFVACAASLQSPPPVPKVAPFQYFANRCARCHGPDGSHYGPEFGKGLSDAQLIHVVEEMAEGPGGEPIHGADLDAVVAWHRALIRREPFVVVLQRGPTVWSGECTPGAQVTAREGSRTVAAKVNGSRWSVRLNKRWKGALEVRKAGHTIRLDPFAKSFSHSTPLSPGRSRSDATGQQALGSSDSARGHRSQ